MKDIIYNSPPSPSFLPLLVVSCSTHPSMNVSTDGLVPLESCINSRHVLPLVQLLQDLTHVVEPRLTEGGFAGELLGQLKQLFLSGEGGRRDVGEEGRGRGKGGGGDVGKEGGREGGREGGKEGEREGGREGGKEEAIFIP